jgi:hypothetical protein
MDSLQAVVSDPDASPAARVGAVKTVNETMNAMARHPLAAPRPALPPADDEIEGEATPVSFDPGSSTMDDIVSALDNE